MPEIKHTFAGGKMNKDMDERIVLDGQYRDALNIQIATSDGSNVGSAQNIPGNTKKDTTATGDTIVLSNAVCVGALINDSTSKIYSLISSRIAGGISKDYIFEFDTKTNRSKYVFIDIHSVSFVSLTTVSNNIVYISDSASPNINKTGVRIGMSFTSGLYSLDNDITVTNIIYDTGNSRWAIYLSESVSVTASDIGIFIANKVLNFPRTGLITGINILGDSLFWTDNSTEPKRINITRSIAGTGGTEYLHTGLATSNAAHAGFGYISLNTSNTSNSFSGDTGYFHTRLTKSVLTGATTDNSFEVVTNTAKNKVVDVEEAHITVIRKAPTQPLQLDMSRTSLSRIASDGAINPVSTVAPNVIINNTLFPAGSTISNVTVSSNVDFRIGDIVLFRALLVNTSSNSSGNSVRTEVTESSVTNSNSMATTGFDFKVISIVPDLPGESTDWDLTLEDAEPMFRSRFPRFSYRYKYEDGEYSTFAPWSKVAFLSDTFEYLPKKGYNLGMVNQLRGLKLKGYHPFNTPEDVVSIDILYKETNNPTVYSVKTVKPVDGHPIWPSLSADVDSRGEFEVKTDMIHMVVPSNQLLRPWDNVPRKALGQEVSANRLIYGNYLHNYTVNKDPIINVSLDQLATVSDTQPSSPSVKTLRDYQVGVVFSDEYGRETPVLTNEGAAINVPIEASYTSNRLKVNMGFGTIIPDWAKYFSYYIKEASTEYNNLPMDRWYNASDGNIWLSFPSSERNKLDLESFIYLKKTHGTDDFAGGKTKYKILAIEEEAPDFIKTKRKVAGTCYNTDSNNNENFGNSNGGYLYEGFDYVIVVESVFDGAFGSDFMTRVPDTLTVSFSDGDNRTVEYKVDQISKSSADYYIVKIEGVFGSDVSFATTNGMWSGRIDNLRMQMSQYDTENKPEFDGRFFAKIFKDANLTSYVLSYTQPEANYIVDASWNCKYINNNGYNINPPNFHPSVPYNAKEVTQAQASLWDMQTGSSSGERKYHPTVYSHHYQYYWDSGTTGVNVNDINNHPVRAVNGSSGDSENFWEDVASAKMFFIDACTAYSWAGEQNNKPGNHYIGDNTTEIWSSGAHAWGRKEGAPAFGGYQQVQGNMKSQRGMPSRGIWNAPNQDSSSYMDISWAGMGVAHDGANWSSIPYPHMLQDLSSEASYTSAGNFIMTLVEPGTKFRFRLDPDKTIYTVEDFSSAFLFGYNMSYHWKNGSNYKSGAFGIRNYKTSDDKHQFEGANMRQRWTLKVYPKIGSGPSGYNPVTGTVPQSNVSVTALHHDGTNNDQIDIMVPEESGDIYGNISNYNNNPAVWEVEPKESVDIDIYYQASGLIPLKLNNKTNEGYIPIGSTFKLVNSTGLASTHTVTSWDHKTITFTPVVPADVTLNNFTTIEFDKSDNHSLTAMIAGTYSENASAFILRDSIASLGNSELLHRQTHKLPWNNCWSFGNGVESDRIRDDYNENQMDNGVKASSVLNKQLKEERRKHGLIWSGIYNSNVGINDTNQFIIAEGITKDLNPSYGSIQALLNRDTRLVMFCEDKVLRAETNKDALYNADGNPQLIASNRVIGDVTPYRGDYGISRNPESLAITPNNSYFTDIDRGQVLVLSVEGVRSISDVGMRNYFSKFKSSFIDKAVGSYDNESNEYNITISEKLPVIKNSTISYSERSKGWVSFKSFIPEMGVSIDNDYYTFKNGYTYKHHSNSLFNNFYGTPYTSSITLLFNDISGSVKSFGSINYEGSQAKVTEFDTATVNFFNNNYALNGLDGLISVTVNDSEFFNLNASLGWYTDSIKTNLQDSGIIEFKNKEGKWFGYPTGVASTLSNLDTKEFSTQGLGEASIVTEDPGLGNPSSIYISDSSAGGWD